MAYVFSAYLTGKRSRSAGWALDEVHRAQAEATAAKEEAARARLSEATMGAELSAALAMAAGPLQEESTQCSPCSSDGGSTASSLWPDTASPFSVDSSGSGTTVGSDSHIVPPRALPTPPPPLRASPSPPSPPAPPPQHSIAAGVPVAVVGDTERCPFCLCGDSGGDSSDAGGGQPGSTQTLGRLLSWNNKRRRETPPVSAFDDTIRLR